MKYQTPMKPFAHQDEALKKMKGRHAFALLMAMRTGKTKVVLDDFGQLEYDGKAYDLFVTAPGGAYKTWETAIPEHVSKDLRERLYMHVWEASSNSQATKRELEKFLACLDRPRALIINIESLSAVERARELSMRFARQRNGFCYGVVDESTIIKGNDSIRTKFMNEKMRQHFKYRRILSGLPSPNSPLDLFSQFWFLDPKILGHETYATYQARYAEIFNLCMEPNPVLFAKARQFLGEAVYLPGVGTIKIADLGREHILKLIERKNAQREALGLKKFWIRTVPMIKEYKNENELWDLIKPYSYRKLLKDCYDLPPKIYTQRHVDLTPEQKRIYKELKEQATAELEAKVYVTATMVVTRVLRLHQVLCGHVVDDDEKLIRAIPEKRTEQVLEILDEYDGKAIIWCSYDYDIRKISDKLIKKYGTDSVARFWGGNKSTRESEEKQFLRNPQTRFMVATAAAGGRGRTWTIANMMIYYSNTNNLEHRLQSEERGEAIGKIEPMSCIDLVTPGTVDIKILRSLRDKIDMAAVITNDNWREWVV